MCRILHHVFTPDYLCCNPFPPLPLVLSLTDELVHQEGPATLRLCLHWYCVHNSLSMLSTPSSALIEGCRTMWRTLVMSSLQSCLWCKTHQSTSVTPGASWIGDCLTSRVQATSRSKLVESLSALQHHHQCTYACVYCARTHARTHTHTHTVRILSTYPTVGGLQSSGCDYGQCDPQDGRRMRCSAHSHVFTFLLFNVTTHRPPTHLGGRALLGE